MSKAGKIIQNPRSGEQFTFLKPAEETDGELTLFEWILQSHCSVPYPHIHPQQTETFNVLEGELCLMVDGKEIIIKAGESATVPKGVVHQPHNRSEKPVRGYLTFRPALHIETRLEIICGMATDGIVNSKGSPPFWQLAVLESAYPNTTYLAVSPIWRQRLILKAGAFIGRMLGYKAYYAKYCSP